MKKSKFLLLVVLIAASIGTLLAFNARQMSETGICTAPTDVPDAACKLLKNFTTSADGDLAYVDWPTRDTVCPPICSTLARISRQE